MTEQDGHRLAARVVLTQWIRASQGGSPNASSDPWPAWAQEIQDDLDRLIINDLLALVGDGQWTKR